MRRPHAGLPFILMNLEEKRMRIQGVFPTLLALIVAVMLTAAPASAQHTTGVPGSPSATETIDGKYLPPPKCGGEINLNADQSKPWWAPTVVPPKGAPKTEVIS